jgi:hypothetical protein
MTSSERATSLQVFAKALQDRPLDPALAEDHRLYVEELHVQKHDGLTIDPVTRLARQIERSEGSRVWLFTGNIGSGKSTELRHLRQDLQATGSIVFLADAADYINLNQKIEIGDFLISVTAAFAEQAGDYLRSDEIKAGYWERIRNFLTRTEVEFKEISAGGGVELAGPVKLSLKGDLKAALRQDPVVKELLQKHLRGHLTSLAEDLEAYRGEILEKLRAKAGARAKVVMLLDSLERLRGSGDAGDEVFSSVKGLFTQYPDMLRLHDVQVVYSVAPYLIKLAPQLGGLFGAGTLCHLTTAHVFKSRSRELDAEGGVRVIREIVTRRYPAWKDLLPGSALDRLIENSGGDLRDLFRLLSIVLLELEFSDNVGAVLSFALEQVRRDMTWVTAPQLSRLRYLAQTKEPRLDNDEDRDALVHDLETKRVLMYRNGSDWFDVHPLLRSLLEAPAGAAGGGN